MVVTIFDGPKFDCEHQTINIQKDHKIRREILFIDMVLRIKTISIYVYAIYNQEKVRRCRT